MTKYSDYYEQVLYPIQDEILKILKNLELPFYLTGGTAVSRGYLNHRYSDDLDLFTENTTDFQKSIDTIFNTLETKGFTIEFSDYASPTFSRIFVNKNRNGLNKNGLKIDLAADTVPHFGGLKQTPVYYRTDSIQNILSNKYTALYRISVKDAVDIYSIASNFDWKKVIQEAEQKEIGIDLKEVTEILSSYNEKMLANVKWTTPKTREEILEIQTGLDILAQDMLLLKENSIVKTKPICKENSIKQWYIGKPEKGNRSAEIVFGFFFSREGAPDGKKGHTSPIRSVTTNEREREYEIQTENTLYHCSFDSINFEEQDKSSFVLPEYERIKKECFHPAGIEPNELETGGHGEIGDRTA